MSEKYINRVEILEEIIDSLLNINTMEKRYWSDEITEYFWYEPTPYLYLKKLLKEFEFKKNDHVVDIGCGKGRFMFYSNFLKDIRVTGIEANHLTFLDCEENLESYRSKNKDKIKVINTLAEKYEFEDDQNIFYLFNPFTLDIFKKVMDNIIKSINRKPRKVTIIGFYMTVDYLLYLSDETDFKYKGKIEIQGELDDHMLFRVYEYDPDKKEDD